MKYTYVIAAVLALILAINAAAVIYVTQTTHNTTTDNCNANDRQNQVLVRLLSAVLIAEKDLSPHLKTAFVEEVRKLRIPTCRN